MEQPTHLTDQVVNALATETRGLFSRYTQQGDVQAGNRLIEIGDILTQALVCGCSTLDQLLGKWTEHQYRPTLKDSPAASLLADLYDYVAAQRGLDVTAYRGLDRDRRRTPSAIDALEGAIEMLTHIRNGGYYEGDDFYARLQRFEDARDEYRRGEMILARNRAAIREMASVRRSG